MVGSRGRRGRKDRSEIADQAPRPTIKVPKTPTGQRLRRAWLYMYMYSKLASGDGDGDGAIAIASRWRPRRAKRAEAALEPASAREARRKKWGAGAVRGY